MELDTPHPAAPAPTAAWPRRRRLTLGLTALALVAGGGVAIAAGSTSGGNETAQPAAPGKALDRQGVRGGVLHSESVFSDGNGGYVTRLLQVGKIESIDAGNLTVVSADGFRQAWKRTADTVVGGGKWDVTKNDDGSWTVRRSDGTQLATGDAVVVSGTVADGTATAQRIAGEGAGEPGGKAAGKAGLPPGLLKGLDEGAAPGADGGPMKGGRLGGPGGMGGPGGKIRRFEFRGGQNGEGGSMVSPANPEAPLPAAPDPEAPPAPGAAPAEPSVADSSGSVSFT